MRNEAVLPVAQFLARAWSGKPRVIVKMSTDVKIPEAYEAQHFDATELGIKMPPPSRYPTTELITAYRLWRASLWHESMHHYYGFPKGRRDTSYMSWQVANIIEDYRVELLGVQEYPGMARELELRRAVYYHLAPEAHDPLQMYEQLLLLGAVKGVRPGDMPDSVVEAVKFTKEAVRSGCSSLDIAEEVCRMLGLDPRKHRALPEPVVDFPVPLNKRLRSKELKRAVEEWLEAREEAEERGAGKPRGEGQPQQPSAQPDRRAAAQSSEAGAQQEGGEAKRNLAKQAEELLKPPVEVAEELEQVRAENQRLEQRREGAAAEVEGGIHLPSQLNVDESPYYDTDLINRLRAQLRRLRKKWVEVPSSTGELDVDSYVSRHPKAFIDEERLKVGGYRVLMLLDHSGSIFAYQEQYKKACIALAEALSALGVPFAVYAFAATPYTSGVQIFLVKGFSERWTRMNAKRLAQIPADGGTPLGTVYERLEGIAKGRGKLYFITLTDGCPNPSEIQLCKRKVRELRKHCRMVAIALERSMEEAVRLANRLGYLGYDRYVALDDVRKLPEKVLKLLGE